MALSVEDLSDTIGISLRQFFVTYKKLGMFSGQAYLLAVEDFGLMICCINRATYTQVDNYLDNNFKDWGRLYITPDEQLLDKRYDILFALMRGGYMKWLRYQYPRQIKNVLLGTDNLARRIINERLRIWNNKAKYKFLIEDNKAALVNNMSQELANDNSFFDYMPEE